MRRVAVVGAGSIADIAHVAAVRANAPRAELVAVADSSTASAEAFAARHGIPAAFGSLEALLAAESPDLVHICTPPATHAFLATEALDAGAWVLLEKPPTLSLAEFDQIEAAERDSGPYASVVFQHRFGAAGQHAARILASGAVGRPLVAVCNTVWFRPQEYYDVPWRGRWETEGGGPTMGLGIHQIDLLLTLLGPWADVTAVAERLDRVIEVEDVSMAIVRFENGALASVVNSALSPRQESYVRIDTTDVTIEVSHLYGYGNDDWTWTGAPHVDPALVQQWSAPGAQTRSSHTEQVRQVLDAMDAGRRPPLSGAEGRAALELVTAIYQSAFTGRAVRREELVPGSPCYAGPRGPG